jgi:hypothetical protein
MQKKFVALCLLASVSVMSVRAMNQNVRLYEENGSEAQEVARNTVMLYTAMPKNKLISLNSINPAGVPGGELYADGVRMRLAGGDTNVVTAQQAICALDKNASHQFSFTQKIRAGVIGADYFLRCAGSYNSMAFLGALLAKVGQFKGIGAAAALKVTPLIKMITATNAGTAAVTFAGYTLPCMVSAPVVLGAGYDIYQGGWAKFGTYYTDRISELPENIVLTILGNKPVLMARYVVANLWNNARLPFKGIFDLITKPVV